MSHISAQPGSSSTEPGRRSNGIGDFLLAHELAIAFWVLTAMVLTPVFLVDVPPLADYVNHLARMKVIASMGHDPFLDGFYKIDWQLIPNLAMDLIVPVVARVVDIYKAGQFFTALTVLTLVTGPMAIHRALYGRYNAFPLVAFVLLYNGVFLIGLMNYVFGVGLAMWGLAAWIMLRQRSLVLRMAVSAVFCVTLYVCHLYAVGFYGMAIGAFELWAWSKRSYRLDRIVLRELAALIVPVLPVLPMLFGSATWTLARDNEWTSRSKIDGLVLIFRTYTDSFDLAVALLIAVAMGWAISRRLVSFHGAALPLLVVGSAVFLIMPDMLFGSYMADQRLPVALLLMLIGFVHLDPEDLWPRAGFLVMVIAFAALRVGDVGLHWVKIGGVYDEFRTALTDVPRGAKVLVAYADDPQGSQATQEALSHAPCVAMIERSALVSTAFTVKGKQIMSMRPEYQARVDTEDGTPPGVSQLVAASYVRDEGAPRLHYWDDWTNDHDYLFVLYTARDSANPDPDDLKLVHNGRGFQLYQIRH